MIAFSKSNMATASSDMFSLLDYITSHLKVWTWRQFIHWFSHCSFPPFFRTNISTWFSSVFLYPLSIPLILLWVATYRHNLPNHSLHVFGLCAWRKPTDTHGDHAKSTQKNPNQTRIWTPNLLAARVVTTGPQCHLCPCSKCHHFLVQMSPNLIAMFIYMELPFP